MNLRTPYTPCFLENPACAEHLKIKELMENDNIILLFLEAFPEFCVKDTQDLGESRGENGQFFIVYLRTKFRAGEHRQSFTNASII